MDKSQKELLKSYFHSRGIAREQNSDLYGYSGYEIFYGLKNGLIKIKDINDLTSFEKTNYYNTKLGTDKFKWVNEFEYANGNLRLAILNDDTYILINKEGQPSIEGITKDEINEMNSYEVAAYYNTKLRTNKFRGIYGFDFANGNYVYINKNGEIVNYN